MENVYGHLTRVQRGLIRVDADELTYPLHIMLRYELEKQLLAGELAVRDLPEAWNAGMEQRLGIRPANDVEGCLQDIHWAVGSFGYFPSYALGAVIAAQLYESLRAELPALDEQLARGEFSRAVRVAAQARARPRRQGARAGAAEERHRQAAVGHFLHALCRGKVPREHRQQRRGLRVSCFRRHERGGPVP